MVQELQKVKKESKHQKGRECSLQSVMYQQHTCTQCVNSTHYYYVAQSPHPGLTSVRQYQGVPGALQTSMAESPVGSCELCWHSREL